MELEVLEILVGTVAAAIISIRFVWRLCDRPDRGAEWLRCFLAVAAFFAMILLLLPGSAEFYGRGNIDLDSRIVVANPDGTFSTEKSFSVEIDGWEVLLPTIIDGKVVGREDAIEHFLSTGEHLGYFTSIATANQYADWLHERQEVLYGAGK